MTRAEWKILIFVIVWLMFLTFIATSPKPCNAKGGHHGYRAAKAHVSHPNRYKKPMTTYTP